MEAIAPLFPAFSFPSTKKQTPVFSANTTPFDATVEGELESSPYSTLPFWNTAGRPANPKEGTLGFNIDTKSLETWSGSRWVSLKMKKI